MKKLNLWYAVLWRRIDRRARRFFFEFDTPIRRRLYEQKRDIAVNEVLTEAQKIELTRINRTLGNGDIYRLTPEQRRRQTEMAAQIMRDMKKK